MCLGVYPARQTSDGSAAIPGPEQPRKPSLTEAEAQALVARLMSLQTQSAFALKTAVMALETPGVRGTLVIEIPSSPKDYPELTFRTGS